VEDERAVNLISTQTGTPRQSFRSAYFVVVSCTEMTTPSQSTIIPFFRPVWKSKFYGAFALNHRVVLHAIDATPAR